MSKIFKAGVGAAASIGASAKKMDFSKFAKASSKSGGSAADLAKKAAKKSDDAADLAKTAAKKSDDAADLSKNAAKTADDAADLSKNAAKTADDVADLGKKSKKLSTNAKKALAGGAAAGGLLYLDKKYKDADEDIKDCMKLCLPTNWDEYDSGTLDPSKLQYKVLEEEDEDQPMCTAEIPECGEYCGEKCEEIHNYDLPGQNLVKNAAEDAGDAAGGIFKGLFGGLFKGLGLDGNTGMIASGVSSCSCCLLILAAGAMSM